MEQLLSLGCPELDQDRKWAMGIRCQLSMLALLMAGNVVDIICAVAASWARLQCKSVDSESVAHAFHKAV